MVADLSSKCRLKRIVGPLSGNSYGDTVADDLACLDLITANMAVAEMNRLDKCSTTELDALQDAIVRPIAGRPAQSARRRR